jgi:hypothetical protein
MVKMNRQIQTIPETASTRKKNLLCSIILYSALTYFLVLALLFLAGTVFSGKITSFLEPYYLQKASLAINFFWIVFVGTALYSTAGTGIILFLLGRKGGFYIFILAGVLIFSLELYYLIFDWLRYLIHSGYIFLLGIAHFSGKCYKKKEA